MADNAHKNSSQEFAQSLFDALDHLYATCSAQPHRENYLGVLPREIYEELITFAAYNSWDEQFALKPAARFDKRDGGLAMSCVHLPERNSVITAHALGKLEEFRLPKAGKGLISSAGKIPFDAAEGRGIWSLLVTPQFLVIGGKDGSEETELILYDRSSLTKVKSVFATTSDNGIKRMQLIKTVSSQFSPLVIITAGDGHMFVWNYPELTSRYDLGKSLDAYPDRPWSLHQFNGHLYCGMKQKSIHYVFVWNQELQVIRQIPVVKEVFSLTKHDEHLFVGLWDGEIEVIKEATGETLYRLEANGSPASVLEIRGDILIGGFYGGNFMRWNWKTNVVISKEQEHDADINFLYILPREIAITGSDNGRIIFWHLEPKEQKK